MTFEVSKVYHPVVVSQMTTNDIIFKVLFVLNGDTNLVILIHNVNSKNTIETMFVDSFPMFAYILASTTISRTTFYYGAIHLVNKISYKCGLQIMLVATFSCGNLYGNSAINLNSKHFV